MTFNLVLNSNNVVSGSSNTRYSYSFLGNTSLTILDESEIAISNCTVPYSWFNISAAYGNNKFAFTFPTSASSATSYSFTLADGFYSVVDINAALQQFCITNGLYLISKTGNFVYYVTFLYNESKYAIQLVLSVVPIVLPAGWSVPVASTLGAAWNGFWTAAVIPTVTISLAAFGKIIGFATGTYGTVGGTVARSFLSTLAPQGSPVNSLVIRCSLVDNSVCVPSDILDTMPITATFGSNINYMPPALKWVRMAAGTYQKLELLFVDQNLASMAILDSSVCISLLINNKGKPVNSVNTPKLSFR
jgi:hypothetical protein